MISASKEKLEAEDGTNNIMLEEISINRGCQEVFPHTSMESDVDQTQLEYIPENFRQRRNEEWQNIDLEKAKQRTTYGYINESLHSDNLRKYEPSAHQDNPQWRYSCDSEIFQDPIYMNDSRGLLSEFQFGKRMGDINVYEDDESVSEPSASLLIERTPAHLTSKEKVQSRFQNRSFTKIDLRKQQLSLAKFHSVCNLDRFYKRVYNYYEEKGVNCILLRKVFFLILLGFGIAFVALLSLGIDYESLLVRKKLWEAIRADGLQRASSFGLITLLLFITFWMTHLVMLIKDLKPLREMNDFYTHVLEIPECDIQSIEWREVVQRIGEIHKTHVSRPSPNALQLTNRIMRKDNYMVALYNRDVLDISICIPFLGKKWILPKTLEWSLKWIILTFAFGEDGSIRKWILSNIHKKDLSQQLRKRFIIVGLFHFFLMPFIFIFLLIRYVLQYGQEFHKNPSSIGVRNYTLYAKWLFREFNELPHVFQRRLNASHPKAERYVNQFPQEKTSLLARFIYLICGAIALPLAVFVFFNEHILLDLEVFPHISVLSYLTMCATVMGITRQLYPNEFSIGLFRPALMMKEVMRDTHWYPDHWRGKLSTDEVHREFGEYFTFRVILLFYDIIGVLLTPYILCFKMPDRADDIIDTFRDFTTKAEGIGYICSFAAFDFRKHGNYRFGTHGDVRNEHQCSKGGKMEQSFLNFKANHPDWEPSEDGKEYMKRVITPTASFDNIKDFGSVDSEAAGRLKRSDLSNIIGNSPIQGYNEGKFFQQPYDNVIQDPSLFSPEIRPTLSDVIPDKVHISISSQDSEEMSSPPLEYMTRDKLPEFRGNQKQIEESLTSENGYKGDNVFSLLAQFYDNSDVV